MQISKPKLKQHSKKNLLKNNKVINTRQMKLFTEIRKQESAGEVVFDKKIKRLRVKIVKDKKGYTAYIDGDKLDTFRSEKDAKRGIDFAIKELT